MAGNLLEDNIHRTASEILKLEASDNMIDLKYQDQVG
jgi:hypothetical protein